MYLAVWINDQESVPNRRIHLCTPLLKRLNAAIALLKSHERFESDSLVLSGETRQFREFVRLLEEADDQWGMDNARIVDAITIIAAKAGCSVVPFGSVPKGVTSSVAIKAEVKKAPRVGLYPRYITKPGKAVWDDVLEKYRRTIETYKDDKEKMWAAAIIIYQRVANAQNIKPFTRDFGQSHRDKTRTTTHQRMNQSNYKALKAVENAAQLLAKHKLAGQLTKEAFWEVAYENNRYYITTFQKLNSPDARHALQVLLDNYWGTGVPGRYAHRAIDMYTDVMAEAPKAKVVYFYIVLHITRDLMSILFPSLENADSQTIMRTLGKAGRQWVRTGTMKAVASGPMTLTVHLNERSARAVVEAVLKRLGEDYFYRSRSELRAMGYPNRYAPQIHVVDTSLSVSNLESLILQEANRRGLRTLGFEVVD